jgi:hypothetical protein
MLEERPGCMIDASPQPIAAHSAAGFMPRMVDSVPRRTGDPHREPDADRNHPQLADERPLL